MPKVPRELGAVMNIQRAPMAGGHARGGATRAHEVAGHEVLAVVGRPARSAGSSPTECGADYADDGDYAGTVEAPGGFAGGWGWSRGEQHPA